MTSLRVSVFDSMSQLKLSNFSTSNKSPPPLFTHGSWKVLSPMTTPSFFSPPSPSHSHKHTKTMGPIRQNNFDWPFYSVASVTRFGKISPLRQKFGLRQILKCPLSIWLNFEHTLTNSLCYWVNFHLFSFVFSNNITILQQINVKNVHPVYSAGILTHDLWIVSLLP